jgi:hypothetical protein
MEEERDGTIQMAVVGNGLHQDTEIVAAQRSRSPGYRSGWLITILLACFFSVFSAFMIHGDFLPTAGELAPMSYPFSNWKYWFMSLPQVLNFVIIFTFVKSKGCGSRLFVSLLFLTAAELLISLSNSIAYQLVFQALCLLLMALPLSLKESNLFRNIQPVRLFLMAFYLSMQQVLPLFAMGRLRDTGLIIAAACMLSYLFLSIFVLVSRVVSAWSFKLPREIPFSVAYASFLIFACIIILSLVLSFSYSPYYPGIPLLISYNLLAVMGLTVLHHRKLDKYLHKHMLGVAFISLIALMAASIYYAIAPEIAGHHSGSIAMTEATLGTKNATELLDTTTDLFDGNEDYNYEGEEGSGAW